MEVEGKRTGRLKFDQDGDMLTHRQQQAHTHAYTQIVVVVVVVAICARIHTPMHTHSLPPPPPYTGGRTEVNEESTGGAGTHVRASAHCVPKSQEPRTSSVTSYQDGTCRGEGGNLNKSQQYYRE